MGRKKIDRFSDVSFPDYLPPVELAEYQVFMSFCNDDDAVSFREWWDSEGSVAFLEYLDGGG